MIMRWSWPGQVGEAAVLEFARYQFLFVISAALGLVNQLSTIAGLLGNLVSFGRLIERRLYPRRAEAKRDADAELRKQPRKEK